MIGTFNLPIAENKAKTYIYQPVNLGANGAGVEISMQKWEKPKGINFIYCLMIGAGSGGGGGYSFGAGTATGGGGGGGSPGCAVQFIQPAYLVPDILYIQVSTGGIGGAAGANGGFGNLITGLYHSQFSAVVNSTSRTYYALPNTVQTGTASGRSGSVAAGGAGGTISNVSTTLIQPGIMGFSNYSLATSLTGFNAVLGAAGADATFGGLPQGGAGGGSVNAGVATAGGNVLAPSTSPNSIWKQNLPGGANTGVSGSNGITLFNPTFFTLPGAGGGGNPTGVGGDGGKGGIGCGGGGGGAGTTGGRGGNGGDGLVMIVCW